MNDSGETLSGSTWDVEQLLTDALRPMEPPERLSGRFEDTLAAITQAAAKELSDWAEELSESELRALRDPATGCARWSPSAPAGSPPGPWCCWSCAVAASTAARVA